MLAALGIPVSDLAPWHEPLPLDSDVNHGLKVAEALVLVDEIHPVTAEALATYARSWCTDFPTINQCAPIGQGAGRLGRHFPAGHGRAGRLWNELRPSPRISFGCVMGVFRAGSLNDVVTTANLSKTYGSILVRVCRVDGQQSSNGSNEDLKLNETRNRLVSPVA
mgnify:CR=1 FL=1